MVATFNQTNTVKGGDRRLQIDTNQALTQLRLLGYDESETIYLREFAGKPAKHYPNVRPKKSSATLATLPQYQSRDRGLYLVVNGQGQRKSDITTIRALFCEWDDRPIEDQLLLWEENGMVEPTLQVVTRKSVHSYWVLNEPVPVADGEELQKDLLEWLDGDRALKDPSRVMRLAGAWHIGKDEEGNELEPIRCDIVHQSEKRYSHEELRKLIPPFTRLQKEEEEKQRQEKRALASSEICKADRTSTSPNSNQVKSPVSNRLPKHPDYIQLPVPEAVPLLQCCSKATRSLVGTGTPEGSGRNNDALKIAVEVTEVAGYLSSIGQTYLDTPEESIRDFCERSGMTPRETEDRVKWCESRKVKDPRHPESIEACIRGWYWNHYIKPEWEKRNNDGGGNNHPPYNGDGGNGGNNGDGKPKRNHWNAPQSWNGELGWWVKPKNSKDDEIPVDDEHRAEILEFRPMTNFDFIIERELSDDEGGGLVLQVKRSIDTRQRRVIIRSLDFTRSHDFINALKKSYGAGIICNLKPQHIGALIHTRLVEYRDRGGQLFKLADRHGQQEDGTWVFESIQFSRNGEGTYEEESKVVFNPDLGGEDKMPVPEVALPDDEALPRLVKAMRRFHGDSQIDPAILTLGWATAGIHYQRIMQIEGRFPLLNLVGDAGGGKTILASNALSLVGWTGTKGSFSHITESALYETLKHCGSLPVCFDDPQRSRELDELLKRLYNGVERRVRGNSQKPNAPVMVTSNHACGDDQPATLSRLIQVPIYRSTDGDATAWDELVEAQKLASGALPQLIKMGYPSLEIRELANELRQHLPHAHQRVADSFGLVLWYSMAVAKLGGFDPERVKGYVVNVLCKLANDADSASDSLTDFLDKIYSLKATSKIGDWNIRLVESNEIGNAIALHMPSVWSALDKEFHPPYSRRVVEALIDKAGGKLKAVQKFHSSEDESKAYRRLLLSPRTDSDGNEIPPLEPEYKPRRCILIPAHLASDFIDSWRDDTPPDDDGGGNGGNNPPQNDNDGGGNSVTPQLHELHPVTPQLHEKCNQQDLDGESDSAISKESVTFFSDMTTLEKSPEDTTDATQDYKEGENKNDVIPEKNVTEEILEPETKTEREVHWLHEKCNQQVTGCNQGVTDVTKEDDPEQYEGFRTGDQVKITQPNEAHLGVGVVKIISREISNAPTEKFISVKFANGYEDVYYPNQLQKVE